MQRTTTKQTAEKTGEEKNTTATTLRKKVTFRGKKPDKKTNWAKQKQKHGTRKTSQKKKPTRTTAKKTGDKTWRKKSEPILVRTAW